MEEDHSVNTYIRDIWDHHRLLNTCITDTWGDGTLLNTYITDIWDDGTLLNTYVTNTWNDHRLHNRSTRDTMHLVLDGENIVVSFTTHTSQRHGIYSSRRMATNGKRIVANFRERSLLFPKVRANGKYDDGYHVVKALPKKTACHSTQDVE